MNEQTKSLAMQYAHKMGNSVLYNAERMEAFAQLIVRECVLISRTSTDGFSAGQRMEEHFGVEE